MTALTNPFGKLSSDEGDDYGDDRSSRTGLGRGEVSRIQAVHDDPEHENYVYGVRKRLDPFMMVNFALGPRTMRCIRDYGGLRGRQTARTKLLKKSLLIDSPCRSCILREQRWAVSRRQGGPGCYGREDNMGSYLYFFISGRATEVIVAAARGAGTAYGGNPRRP